MSAGDRDWKAVRGDRDQVVPSLTRVIVRLYRERARYCSACGDTFSLGVIVHPENVLDRETGDARPWRRRTKRHGVGDVHVLFCRVCASRIGSFGDLIGKRTWEAA